MSWKSLWTDSLKKKVCKYLLQRYVGDYLQEKISFDQMSVDLYKGIGSLSDVSLDVDMLNEIGETYNLPVEFVDGYIENVTITIPWSTILTTNTFIAVQGLRLTVQPKQRSHCGSMFDSTWSSMATSMEVAQECLKQEQGSASEEGGQVFEGLEVFAQTIESVLCRIKGRFTDTVIRIEHVPKEGQIGIAVEFRIKNVDYLDEAGTKDYSTQTQSRNIYEPAAFSVKKFYIEGVSVYTDEFPSRCRTYAKSISSNESVESRKSADFFSTAPVSPDLPPQHMEFERTNTLGDALPNIATNVSLTPDPILAGQIFGRQEICLTLKQVDALPGAKVGIEISLGSCNFFLTPRQVHSLIELATGLSFPDLEDNSNVAPTRASKNKPMEHVDFARVEEELQKQMHPQHPGKSLEHHQGWSSHCLDDSDDDFLPMGSNRMSSSAVSESSTGDLPQAFLNASFVSACSGPGMSKLEPDSHFTKHYNPLVKGPVQSSFPGSELTHYKIQMSALNLFIMYDDILTTVAENGGLLAQSSVQQMKTITNQFFQDMITLFMNGSTKDLSANRQKFAEISKVNHLRLSAAPVTVEGNEMMVSSVCTSTVSLSCGVLEFVECLIDEKPLKGINDTPEISYEYCDLLVFDKKTDSSQKTEPCLRMKCLHQVQRKGLRSQRQILPKSNVQVTLEPCRVEIDISIVDRISALLDLQPIYRHSYPGPTLYPQSAQACFNQIVEEGDSNVDYKITLKITAPFAAISIRFPIPDLRALHDMDRLPWWKRNVRPDILELQFVNMVWSTTLSSKETGTTVEFRWKDANGYYQKSAKEQAIHFLRAAAESKGPKEEVDENFNWPRLLLKISPLRPPLVVEEEPEECLDSMPLSSIDTLEYNLSQNSQSEPSPFSSRRVVYENQHNRSSDKNDSKDAFSDHDQMVMPGDKAEMSKFIETTTNNCRLHFDFNLPNLTLFLPSKDFYELIYNRISNDLFLWEPTAPKPRMQFDSNGLYMPNMDFGNNATNKTIFHAFGATKSSLNSDSSSGSEDDDHIYYSVYEQRIKQKKHGNENSWQIGQNKVAVTIASTQGKLTIYTPCKEIVAQQEKIIPGHCGEIHLQLKDGLCFILAGFHGQRNVSFVCLQVNQASVHHNSMQPVPMEYPPLHKITQSCIGHLQPTMYHSEPGMYTKLSGYVGTGEDSLDMVSVAIKVNLDANSNIKTFKVALGIKEATIRYRTGSTIQSSLEQFADFFNVTDQYVPGYKEPDIVTELHLHLWGCAMDYRPLYLPMRAAITMESLSISSTITAHSNSSQLRFIAEDANLFISQNCNAAHVDLKKDYVSVIDIGLCDVYKQYETFKTMNDTPPSPYNVAKDLGILHRDMKARIDCFHIRTCSDSFCALQDLIAYCVNYGDLGPSDEKSKSVSSEPSSEISDTSIESQEEDMHTLMAEAMRESSCSSLSFHGGTLLSRPEAVTAPSSGEVFLFPDEAGRTSGDMATHLREMRDSSLPIPEDGDIIDSGDDEFFILEDDPGVGFVPKNGEPEVRVLVQEPIRLIESFYTIPDRKTDQLKAPKSFPFPEERYTLQEMSIIWHMHGGNDFPSTSTKTKKAKEKHVKMDDGCDGYDNCDYATISMSFNPSSPNTVNWVDGRSQMKGSPAHHSNKNWKLQGGPGRLVDAMELQLNKVRLRYEKYPPGAEQAAWQILLIHEVEIRDRLSCSQINKFLYQYSSEALPRQTHANMVVMKAVHVRPDPTLPGQECSVKVSILPLRLNIDQDTLNFIRSYFADVAARTNVNSSADERKSRLQAPVLSVQSPTGLIPAERSEMLIVLDNTQELVQDLVNPIKETQEAAAASAPVFFRSFTFSPEVLIRLDYDGKHLNMDQGALTGLVLGFAHLTSSELRLKRICYRHGLLGVDKLIAFACNEWLQDIKKHQIPGLLGGVGPMHSLVQLVQGICNLLWFPVQQYQKDGRIVRGLQKGATSFTEFTASAFLELSQRLVQTIQSAFETAYDMLSSGPSVKTHGIIKSSRRNRKRPSQPADLREGMANAYEVVKEGLSDTAKVIVHVASEEHKQKGLTGAVGGVLRELPPIVLKPLILATEATSSVLGGMHHQLVPDARREAAEKWR